jgi:hypothetical protein
MKKIIEYVPHAFVVNRHPNGCTIPTIYMLCFCSISCARSALCSCTVATRRRFKSSYSMGSEFHKPTDFHRIRPNDKSNLTGSKVFSPGLFVGSMDQITYNPSHTLVTSDFTHSLIILRNLHRTVSQVGQSFTCMQECSQGAHSNFVAFLRNIHKHGTKHLLSLDIVVI